MNVKRSVKRLILTLFLVGGIVPLSLFFISLLIAPQHGDAASSQKKALNLRVQSQTATPVKSSKPIAWSPDNLPLSAASYLGGVAANSATAVDISPTGDVVLGGTIPSYSAKGVANANLLKGGAGTIVRLNRTGQTLLSITHIGETINDLHTGSDGSIAVCGDFGVARLDTTASKVLWNANPGAGVHCALGTDNTVAVLVGGSAFVYSANGKALGKWAIGGGFQNDLTVDAKNHLVIAAGFSNKRDSHGGPVQVPFIKAWSYSGSLQWTDYDVNGPSLGDVVADSRGQRVTIGRDGLLYVVGRSAGGNSIFGLDPHDVNKKLGGDRLIATDMYNTPYNTKSNNITFFGRYNPANGNLLKGQFLLSRLPNNNGNTINGYAITADEQGNVYLGGISAYTIQNRDAKKVAGIQTAGYKGGDSFLLVVSPDFTKRLSWGVFTGPGATHDSTLNAISIRNGVFACALTGKEGTLVPVHALQSQPTSKTSNAYVAVAAG